MIRQLIVGRYGPEDTEIIPAAVDEQSTNFQLVAGEKSLDHGIGHAVSELWKMNVYPSEIGLDLMVVAAHVHAADTRISRQTASQDSWTREIRLVVPVSDPERWERAGDTLVRALNFLTGDRWIVGFRRRPERFSDLMIERDLVPHVFDSLSLFSGGLDSLIGAIDLLQGGSTPLLVSHAGEGATSSTQDALHHALERTYDESQFKRLRMWMAFRENLIPDAGSENTTRGRSFLFFSAGVFAGTGLDMEFTLRVPENGLIALNVPLDPLRLGSNSTRTTHPYYIGTWNVLLEELGIPGRIENPYWDKTKGEMVRACANEELLRNVAEHSMSCSSPTKGRWQGHGIGHCGYCLPCLIRRASLQAAWGADGDPTPYTLSDLRERPLRASESEGKQVRSFQVMIERLRGNPALASMLIHKPGPLTEQRDSLEALAGVFGRGLSEVGDLLRGVETRPY